MLQLEQVHPFRSWLHDYQRSYILGAALPVRLLDPAWQLKRIGALVNASGFPLVAMALQAPTLGPTQLAQPVSLVQAQMRELLQKSRGQLALRREALPSANPLRVLPDLVRHGLACLALAIE